MTPVDNILRSIQRAQSSDVGKLNILTICKNNEKYISLLCQTNHNFYINKDNVWNNLIENLPSNLYSLDSLYEPLDYMICYDVAEQYEEAFNISRQLHIPLIIINMCSKSLIRPQSLLETVQATNPDELNRRCSLMVHSTEYIDSSWDNHNAASIVIPIGIDINKFQKQSSSNNNISIDNNTPPQVGAEIGRRIGNTHQIIPTDHSNLEDISVNKTDYFINTNKAITIKVLEAMAAENVVICLKTNDTENFIQHKETGMLINNLDELPDTLKFLEKSNDIKNKISKQAKQKIVAEHSVKEFLSKWSEAFEMIKLAFYIG